MNALIQLKETTAALLAVLLLACFAISPTVKAVVPPPDGGYPGFTTAEGQNALFSLTTGSANTAVGWFSLFSNAEGSFNTATGAGALLFNTADNNTAFGAAALLSNTTGFRNAAVGVAALLNNTEGSANTANGFQALQKNTTGSANTAIGDGALFGNITGSLNIALGANAGANLTTGNHNIDIGNTGQFNDTSTIRIGTNGNHTRTFIAGISGTAVVGDAVVVDANGQLGTTTSSQRFKKDIKPMDQASEVILSLKPVTFHYKKDNTSTTRFGLIAEEVAKVNPALVLPDKEGKPYTVRYDQVNAMLLNEFLKEHCKNEEQEATIARQQKQIEALAAGLQKVRAQVALSKTAPQTASKN